MTVLPCVFSGEKKKKSIFVWSQLLFDSYRIQVEFSLEDEGKAAAGVF